MIIVSGLTAVGRVSAAHGYSDISYFHTLAVKTFFDFFVIRRPRLGKRGEKKLHID